MCVIKWWSNNNQKKIPDLCYFKLDYTHKIAKSIRNFRLLYTCKLHNITHLKLEILR